MENGSPFSLCSFLIPAALPWNFIAEAFLWQPESPWILWDEAILRKAAQESVSSRSDPSSSLGPLQQGCPAVLSLSQTCSALLVCSVCSVAVLLPGLMAVLLFPCPNVCCDGGKNEDPFFLSKPFISIILVVIISFLLHTIFEKIPPLLRSGSWQRSLPSAHPWAREQPVDVVSSLQNYTGCSCVEAPGAAGATRPGTCGTGCSHLFVPFVVLSCLAGILASTSHTPSFMLILRSIQPEDKSFAVGIQFMLLRVLAWMPGPVLYGSAIDTSCVLWERRCERRAACRYYDNTLFRHRYLGLQFFFEVGAFLCFGAVYLILRKQEREASQAEETKAEPEKEKLAGKSTKSPESKV